ncbi:MAG: Ig-like domain-containing protein, partial [Flammeovirgaceae bacterium]|nr:Ig-like domain-containing protein [Flammeovirgaceae bacterium]
VRQLDRSVVEVTYGQNFTQETTYTVRIKGVADLNGNVMSSTLSRTFRYDERPPSLTRFQLLSETRLALTFSENVTATSAQILTNYHVDNGIGNPTSTTLFGGDNRVVYLDFAGGLGDNPNNVLTISGISDWQGNTIVSPIVVNFSTKEPSIGAVTVIASNQLEVLFSEDITTLSAQTLSNYLVAGIGNPTAALQDGSEPALVRLTFAINFVENQSYTLTINNITDLAGNIATNKTASFTYRRFVEKVEVISSNLLRVVFSSEVEQVDANQPTRYMVNNGLGNPVTALRNETSGNTNQVSLLFKDAFTPNLTYQLTIGNIGLTNGNVVPVTTRSFVLDRQPPTITNVEIVNLKTINVIFSESVDKITAEAFEFYSVNNGLGIPTNASLSSSNNRIVRLTFANNISFGVNYTLTVTNVRDLNGNQITTTTASFGLPPSPLAGQLFITEIMADETPQVALPLSEYIEIFNAHTQALSLLGVKIKDSTGETTLANYTIAPNEYLILCPTSAVASFQSYGNVLGVTSWRSLNNSGETIQLINPAGEV